LANRKRYPDIFIQSDLQAPFQHKDYLSHFLYVAKHERCLRRQGGHIINIGDFWDWRYLRRMGTELQLDPDDPITPTEEFTRSLAVTREIMSSQIAPHQICESNHGDRIRRVAKTAYIPQFLLRNYSQILNLSKDVEVARNFVHYGGKVLFEHGHRLKGTSQSALEKLVDKSNCSIVIGHHSAKGGTFYQSSFQHDNPDQRMQRWLLNVGGMIDEKSFGMRWSRDFVARITLGCGVVRWDNYLKKPIPIFYPYD